MGFDGSCRPFQNQQSLEMVITADVVAPNLAKGVLPVSMRVAAENEGYPVGIQGQQLFEPAIAGESIPEQPIYGHGRRQAGKAQARERRMMRHDDDLADLG